jgi:hypothetical protein
VESHISPKTSEMWDTRAFLVTEKRQRQSFDGASPLLADPTYSGANVGHPDRVVTGSQLFGEPHTLSSLARVNGCYVAGRSWFGEDMPNRLVD